MSGDLHTLLQRRAALTAWPLPRAIGLSVAFHAALSLPFLLMGRQAAPAPEELKVTWVTLPAQGGEAGGAAPQEVGEEGERHRRVEDVAPEAGEKTQPMKDPDTAGTREAPTAKGTNKQADAKGSATTAAKGKAPGAPTAPGAAGSGGTGGVGQGTGIPGLKAVTGAKGGFGLIGETDPGLDAPWFLAAVQSRIYENWIRLNNFKGRTGIRFRILKDGRIEGIRIETSSGDATFDRSAEMAVRRSDPFKGGLPPDYKGAALPVLFWFNYLGD